MNQSKTSAKLVVENQAPKGVTYHSSPGTVNVAWGTGSGAAAATQHKYGGFSAQGIIPLLGIVISNQKVQQSINGMFSGMTSDDHSHTYKSNKIQKISQSKQTTVGLNSIETVTSGSKQVTVQAGSMSHVVTSGSMEMRAPAGSASFVGGSTSISSLSGLLGMAGTAGVALDSLGSLLNLNGGIAQIASALGLNLSSLNIITPSLPGQVPQVQGNSSSQPQAEPDATSETDSWL